MKVITDETAARVLALTPEKLRQVLYGYKLSIKEISTAEKRLENLQKKIKDDQKQYAQGYTKGYLIPGTIKIVEDYKEMTSFHTVNRKAGRSKIKKTAKLK